MNKFLKYSLIALGSLIALSVVALAAVALLINPNDYKPQIIQAVADKTQRTLTLDGDIKLALFPKLGLDLGKLSLSEHKGQAEFAAVEGAKLYVAWLPLLHKSLVVDQVRVDGARANLVRNADGSTNYDDLLKKDETPAAESQQLQFDVQGIQISNSAITFDDRMAGRKIALSQINMHSGRLKDGVPTDVALDFSANIDKPLVNTAVKFKSGVLFELEQKHYALSGLDLSVKGAAAGLTDMDLSLKGDIDAKPASTELVAKNLALLLTGKKAADGVNDSINVKLDIPSLQLTQDKVSSDKLVLEAQLQQAKGAIKAIFTVPQLQGTGQAFKASEFTLEVDGQQGENAIKGKLTSPFAGNLQTQRFDLASLKANLNISNPKLPKGNMALNLTGDAHADMIKQDIAANLNTRLDDSRIQARLGMKQFAAPAYRFDVAIDQLDVDRYMPPAAPTSAPQPEKPLDLSALKGLNAQGSVKIGALKVANIKAGNVNVGLKAASGRLNINPLAANLYEGSMSGSASVLAAATPQIALQQNLRGININPLLKDVAGKDMLEGHGSVSLDVVASGATVSAMKKGLNGSASLALRDGAIKGVNLAAMLRKAKAQLGGGGQQVQAASATEKTDFSELTGSFVIRNGVAHNEDLSMKSPLLRLGGNGDINIGDSSMNYLAKVTVVGTLQGQGGADLAALKGITVPVRVAGPFTALSYSLDMNALASEAVKGKVEQKKEEVKTKVEDKLKGQLKGLFGK